MEKNPNYPDSNSKNIYSQLDISDYQNLDSITLSRMNGTGGYVYIDNVQVLIVGQDLAVHISSVAGASIRLNQQNGIRFYTNVDKEKIAKLRADGATVEIGTLIAPVDLLNGKELSFESESYINVPYKS